MLSLKIFVYKKYSKLYAGAMGFPVVLYNFLMILSRTEN